MHAAKLPLLLILASAPAWAGTDLVETNLTDSGLERVVFKHAKVPIYSATIADSPKLKKLSPLAGLRVLRKLTLRGIGPADISALNHLTGRLETLELTRVPGELTLKAVRLRKLRSLTLRDVKLADLTGLENFPKLESLTLEGVSLTSLSGLEGAKGLKHLRLTRCGTGSVAAAALKERITLEELVVVDTPLDSGFAAGLAGLTALTRLRVSGGELASTVARALGGLVALRYLHLDRPLAAGKLDGATALSKLELHLAEGQRFDPAAVKALAGHRSLKWLSLRGPGLDDATVDALGGSGSIARLDVTATDEKVAKETLDRAQPRLQANPRFAKQATAPAFTLQLVDLGGRTVYVTPALVVGVADGVALVRANGAYVPPIEAIAVDVSQGRVLWRKPLDHADRCRLIRRVAVCRLRGKSQTSLLRARDGEPILETSGKLLTDGSLIVIWEATQITVVDAVAGKVLWKRPRKTLDWPRSEPTLFVSGQVLFISAKKLTAFDVQHKVKRWDVMAPRIKNHFTDKFRAGRPGSGSWVHTDRAFYILADRTFYPDYDGVRKGYQQVHGVVLGSGELFSKGLDDEHVYKKMRAQSLTRIGPYIIATVGATGPEKQALYRYAVFDALIKVKGRVAWNTYRAVRTCGSDKYLLLTDPTNGQREVGICSLQGKPLRRVTGRLLSYTRRAGRHPVVHLSGPAGLCRPVLDGGRRLEAVAYSKKKEGAVFECPPELQTAPYYTTAITHHQVLYCDERGLVLIDPTTMKPELEFALSGGKIAQVYQAGKHWLIVDTLGRLHIVTPGRTITGG